MAYLKVLLDPEKVLNSNYHCMNLKELHNHLRALILGEKNSLHPDDYLFKSLRQFETKFREKRLEVANHYLGKGGKINDIMLRNVPFNSENWLGLHDLIGDIDNV